MLPPTSLEALLYFFVRNFAFAFSNSQVTIKCILDVFWPACPYRLSTLLCLKAKRLKPTNIYIILEYDYYTISPTLH